MSLFAFVFENLKAALQISTKTVRAHKNCLCDSDIDVWCAHQLIRSQLIFCYKRGVPSALMMKWLRNTVVPIFRFVVKSRSVVPSPPSPVHLPLLQDWKWRPHCSLPQFPCFYDHVHSLSFSALSLLVSVTLDDHCCWSGCCGTQSRCISTGLFLCNLLHNVILLFLPFPCHQPL